MARIEDLRLRDKGRKRRTTFTLTGVLLWEATEASHNNVELRVNFFGQDRGADDRLANNVAVVVKGRSERVEEGGHSTWTLTSTNPARTEFELVRENSNEFWPTRTFNEDSPGRDAVYAMAVVRDRSTAENLSEWARSNTVTGRY